MSKKEIIKEVERAIKHIAKGSSLYEQEIKEIIWEHYTKEDDYVLVCWPEIQELMPEEGFKENACLCDDTIFVEKYGSSAYFVKKQWLNKHITKP